MSSLGKRISGRLAYFFDVELHCLHYHFFFIRLIKKRTKNTEFVIDKEFEKKSREFYAPYIKNICTLWHVFYASRNGIYDVRYIPENLYYSKIEPHYNNVPFSKAFRDKNYYDILFADVNRAGTIIKNIAGVYTDRHFNLLTKEEAADLCLREKAFVIKPTIDGRGGNRITFIKPEETTKDELLKLFDKYESNFIAEKIIEQSEEMNHLNPTSVNTVRFITFMNKGEVHVLSAVLRIGGKGSKTDNISSGGFSCGIDNKGVTKTKIHDYDCNQYTDGTDGMNFGNRKIVGFEKAKSLVSSLHKRLPHFKILSWDIAFDENNEPLFVELNISPQGITLHQINNGPLFGDLTEEVLLEVFGKR
jgi:hypothetical protein